MVMTLPHDTNDPGSILAFKIVDFLFPCLEKKTKCPEPFLQLMPCMLVRSFSVKLEMSMTLLMRGLFYLS